MLPLYTLAASLVPSADMVIDVQYFISPTDISSVQVTPLFSEVHMFSVSAAAASFVPFADIVIPRQPFGDPTELASDQFVPLLLEVHIPA
jgi:hypothetical protein